MLLILCLLCLLNSCEYVGETTAVSTNIDTTVNGSTSSSTSRTIAPATTGALYIGDDLNGECTGCQLHNAAYIVGGGVVILTPADAYILYALPLQPEFSVQIEFSGAGFTNGDKRILLQLTDSMDAWVGDNHVWMDSSLIEVRHADGRIRFRVGGSGNPEFPTEYVYEGLDSGRHFLTVAVNQTTAVLILDGVTLATFDATTFRPRQLYLFVGGGVLNESSVNVVIHSVGVFY